MLFLALPPEATALYGFQSLKRFTSGALPQILKNTSGPCEAAYVWREEYMSLYFIPILFIHLYLFTHQPFIRYH